MCQYETQAAMPAIVPVADTRNAASPRLCIGMRDVGSTGGSRASGGQAEIAWLIGFGRACRILAATDAATPRMRAARTAQRIRFSCGSCTGLSSVVIRRGRRLGCAAVGVLSVGGSVSSQSSFQIGFLARQLSVGPALV